MDLRPLEDRPFHVAWYVQDFARDTCSIFEYQPLILHGDRPFLVNIKPCETLTCSPAHLHHGLYTNAKKPQRSNLKERNDQNRSSWGGHGGKGAERQLRSICVPPLPL